MWCYGSPTIMRDGNDVFATVPETGKNVKPLNNVRWQLFHREPNSKWELLQTANEFAEREPCPLARLNGKIIISTNPKIKYGDTAPDGRESWSCQPELLEFDLLHPEKLPVKNKPDWDKPYIFSDNSRRGIGVDVNKNEILLVNSVGYDSLGPAWSYYSNGHWSNSGIVKFPIFVSYPEVAIKSGAAYIMAISDIPEPNPQWLNFKKTLSKGFDYDLRTTYFTWTPDIKKTEFSAPLTIATNDETAGAMVNLDMWIGDDGDAHLLYLSQNIKLEEMRNEFWPRMPIIHSLEYCRVSKGKIVDRKTLVEWVDSKKGDNCGLKGERDGCAAFVSRHLRPDWGAFHADAQGRLFVIYHITDKQTYNQKITGNYIMQLFPWEGGMPERLNLKHPLPQFFAAPERNGTKRSNYIDLYGYGEPNTIRYAQIEILN